MMGYKNCRNCGQEINCADLVSGLCPTCAGKRAVRLADLQHQYQVAVDAGEAGAVSRVAEIIRAYLLSEDVRLKNVPTASRVV